MHEYDITLKSVLTRLTANVMAELTGFAIARWHNVELPVVRHRRADMLGETSNGTLVHIELQSNNQPDMPVRMLEYALAIYRKFDRFPEQVVLYVGNAPLTIESSLSTPHIAFEYKLTDIRELDGDQLLASEVLEDNVIAVLAKFADQREAVRRILNRIVAGRPDERATALGDLMVIAGLRKLNTLIEQELEKMPILDDIMDDEVLGRERKRGIALGREEGKIEGELRIVLGLIARRFGSAPEWANQRLNALSAADLEKVSLRLLDAATIEELLS